MNLPNPGNAGLPTARDWISHIEDDTAKRNLGCLAATMFMAASLYYLFIEQDTARTGMVAAAIGLVAALGTCVAQIPRLIANRRWLAKLAAMPANATPPRDDEFQLRRSYLKFRMSPPGLSLPR